MKSILFVIPSMELGGTRTSLLNLLYNMKQCSNISIDLFIINHEGCLMDQIPEWVKVLPEVKAVAFALPNVRRKVLGAKVYHWLVSLFNHFFGYQKVYSFLYHHYGRELLYSNKNYDAVIAYQEGISTFTGSIIPANKHIIWIHSDVDRWFDSKSFEYEAFSDADNIVFVAEHTKGLFIRKFPQYSNKCCIIQNTLNKDLIFEKSRENINNKTTKGLSLLSVGRFSEAKAFDRVILACQYLKSKGYQFSWTLIGDGELYETIKKQAHENRVDDVVAFMGAQSNPFAYMRNTDVVVVSSINESQPMVILESLILSKPVVSTGFGSAKEILQNGKYGLVCENNTESFISAIESLFTNPKLIKDLHAAAESYDYDNDSIIQQLINIIS